ncbi:hypothetical protein BaRGS_00021614 [Batillaria attramentaria]|uniref:Uncharacterized protein n=1 Tax=Batillaria attramentaria TaxID=370345 RepID=A0ABD0KJ88_9CAEN
MTPHVETLKLAYNDANFHSRKSTPSKLPIPFPQLRSFHFIVPNSVLPSFKNKNLLASFKRPVLWRRLLTGVVCRLLQVRQADRKSNPANCACTNLSRTARASRAWGTIRGLGMGQFTRSLLTPGTHKH